MVISKLTWSRPGSRSSLILALACLITLFLNLSMSYAGVPEGILTIETIGSAPVNGDKYSSAEQIAINNALELAVNEGVAMALPAEVLADNFEEIMAAFYGSTETFILNYQTLAMAKGKNYCRVLVRSSISAGDIKKRLRQSGILIDRESSPRLLILLSEELPGQPSTYWWQAGALNFMSAAEKAMTGIFTKTGITAVPHDLRVPGIDRADYTAVLNEEEALEIGRHLGADFVITGRSSVILPGNFTPEKAGDIRGVIDARLLDINTGSTIFNSSLQRQADVAETSSDALSALAATGKAAARQFLPVIITAFEQQKSRPHVFQIRIQGPGYLANLNDFRNILDTIDSINHSQIIEMKIDEAVISVDFTGSSRELARVLDGTRADSLSITVREVLKDSVVIELTTVGMVAD